jgi:hypothetical protein
VRIDDVSYWVIENNDARVFENMKVFASDNFWNPAAGKIKNLKLQTEGKTNNFPIPFPKS